MAKWEEVSISDARARLGELASQVYYQGGGVYLTKNGKIVAAIVPEALAERERVRQERAVYALEKIHELNIGAEMTDEEWEEFVQSEVDAVRAGRAKKEQPDNARVLEPA